MQLKIKNSNRGVCEKNGVNVCGRDPGVLVFEVSRSASSVAVIMIVWTTLLLERTTSTPPTQLRLKAIEELKRTRLQNEKELRNVYALDSPKTRPCLLAMEKEDNKKDREQASMTSAGTQGAQCDFRIWKEKLSATCAGEFSQIEPNDTTFGCFFR